MRSARTRFGAVLIAGVLAAGLAACGGGGGEGGSGGDQTLDVYTNANTQ